MLLRRLATIGLLASLAVPFSVLAQQDLEITVTPTVSCAEASFDVQVSGGSPPYTFEWDFGDGETVVDPDAISPIRHTYPGAGEYLWSLNVLDSADDSAMQQGNVIIEGPQVTLTSDPFPPLLTLNEGQASAVFTADVSGGNPDYTYTWDLDGDGSPDEGADPTSNVRQFTYEAAGKYRASVIVQDSCLLSGSDSLPVLVLDPEDTEVCHPMAQRIADAVNTLFPGQADDLYTCEDIFAYFEGGLTGSQLGFGRMWHAYQLTQSIDELTWEEILDWHLDGFGWGLLVQLDKFAGALDEVSMSDLMGRVLSGENTVGEIRTALRAATRYDADMEDALARLGSGASPGELAQFYKTAAELGVEPASLDGYLEDGVSLSELRHAADLASRSGADWADVVGAHEEGHSWGEISQAYRLADEEADPEMILEEGVQEYRRQLHEESQSTRQAEQDQRTAAQIAQKYGVDVSEVTDLYSGACHQDWGCVRQHFRNQNRSNPGKGKH